MELSVICVPYGVGMVDFNVIIILIINNTTHRLYSVALIHSINVRL